MRKTVGATVLEVAPEQGTVAPIVAIAAGRSAAVENHRSNIKRREGL